MWFCQKQNGYINLHCSLEHVDLGQRGKNELAQAVQEKDTMPTWMAEMPQSHLSKSSRTVWNACWKTPASIHYFQLTPKEQTYKDKIGDLLLGRQGPLLAYCTLQSQGQREPLRLTRISSSLEHSITPRVCGCHGDESSSAFNLAGLKIIFSHPSRSVHTQGGDDISRKKKR